MCVQVVDSKLTGFCERVASEFLESELCNNLRKDTQREKTEAVLRSIIMRNERVRRCDLVEEFVKGGVLGPNELSRILERLTYARFIEREAIRGPASVETVHYRVQRDRIVQNDCIDDMPAVDRVVRVGDSLSIFDELEDHERDVRRVMEELPPGEGELKTLLQDYLNRRRLSKRAERKQKAHNKKNRQSIRR